MNFTILGSGAMGTAISVLLSKNEHNVKIWTRRNSIVESINISHTNERYIRGISLSSRITATTSLNDALLYSENLILAVPSDAINEVLSKIIHINKAPEYILSVIKGLDLKNKTYISKTVVDRMSFPENHYATLSGPNFASELVTNTPSITVIASTSKKTANFFKKALSTKNLLILTSSDLTGVELSSVLKNIFALAIGIVDGLGFGANTRGMIFTQCITDAITIGVSGFDVNLTTILGPACLGDAITTGFSTKSRNYLTGLVLAKSNGTPPSHSFLSEGKNNISFVKEIVDQKGLSVPIIDFINRIIKGKNASESFSLLWKDLFNLSNR